MSTDKKQTTFKNPLLARTDRTVAQPLPALDQITEEQRPTPRPYSTFEANNGRLTTWVELDIKARFEALCKELGRGAKTRLMNEALGDLLRKHKRK